MRDPKVIAAGLVVALANIDSTLRQPPIMTTAKDNYAYALGMLIGTVKLLARELDPTLPPFQMSKEP